MMQQVPRSEDRDVRRDSGFTMIELMVVMSISSTLLAIGVFGFTSYQRTAEHKGTQQELASVLRNTSERAISEGRTYCVDVAENGLAYDIWRGACGTGTLVQGPLKTKDDRVTVLASDTNPAVESVSPTCCITFYPRGTATPTWLTVSSEAREATYTITIEGLTSRVY
jgi:prepilin-type N-terminal cleavage/methylation domain-containing protein